MGQVYGFPSDLSGTDGQPYVERNTYGKGGRFRIVRENRGDLVTGFRVQVETYGRRRPANIFEAEDNSAYGPRWANIGRKLYSLEAAREYRAFLERNHGKQDETTQEVIE